VVDGFFATRIFGPQRLEHFQAQMKGLSAAVQDQSDEKRQRLQKIVSDIDTRLDRQIAAIEAGVDPAVVAERIRQLESKRGEARDRLADLEGNTPTNGGDPDNALAVLQEMPDLSKALIDAKPELRRDVFDAFRLRIELDRNAGQIRLKALVSSAFSGKSLDDLAVARGTIAGAGFEPATFGL
jgi:hypothetical protein